MRIQVFVIRLRLVVPQSRQRIDLHSVEMRTVLPCIDQTRVLVAVSQMRRQQEGESNKCQLSLFVCRVAMSLATVWKRKRKTNGKRKKMNKKTIERKTMTCHTVEIHKVDREMF